MINAQISIFAFYAARIILVSLFIISILCVTFFIERMLFFRRRLMKDASVVATRIERAESVDEITRIMAKCNKEETDIILHALKKSPLSDDAFIKRVDSFFYVQKEKWSRYSTFLGSVGSNAPFIGLLGTVFGILKAFVDLSIAGTGGPQVVMAGISEALIATAVGLAVAIPAVIFYNICKVRVKKSVTNLQSMVALISSKNILTMRSVIQNQKQASGSKLSPLSMK
jgi:biopolymer transport protein ExbB